MASDLDQAISRIAQVVMFENWLRFYFIAEENDTLYLRLPEKAMEQLKQRYSEFYELAQHLNGQEITHDSSLREVCMFVSGSFNDRPLTEELIAKTFDSPRFHLEMQLFSYWVQAHEAQLDAGFLEFSEWQRQFELWKTSDEVKAYAEGLAADIALAAAEGPATTQ